MPISLGFWEWGGPYHCDNGVNEPFPSSKRSHFHNEAKCKTFLVKKSFICIRIKTHFHISGFPVSLTLKQRHGKLENGLFFDNALTDFPQSSRTLS